MAYDSEKEQFEAYESAICQEEIFDGLEIELETKESIYKRKTKRIQTPNRIN